MSTLGYLIIYRTIAIKTNDGRILVLSLEGDSEMTVPSRTRRNTFCIEKHWVLQQLCYPDIPNILLLPTETIVENLKNKILEKSGGTITKSANIRIYSKFVNYEGLQTHILNAINHAITVEEYIQISKYKSFHINIIPCDNNYYRDFYCKTTNDLISAMSYINKYDRVFFDLPEDFMLPKRFKTETTGMYYVYKNDTILSKNRSNITWCNITKQQTSLEYINKEDFKQSNYQPLLFKTVKEAIQYILNYSYDVSLKKLFLYNDVFIGQYNSNNTFSEQNIPILELAKKYGIFVDFYVIYIPKLDSYFHNLGSKYMYTKPNPHKFYTEADAKKKLKDLTEYRDFGLVIQIKRIVGTDEYVVYEYNPPYMQ